MSQSQQKQLHFDLRYTGDFARNFSGGLNKGNLYIGMVEGEFELHSEAVSLWKGGTFFLHALHTHGESVSALVGDLQGVNNIEAFSTFASISMAIDMNSKKDLSLWGKMI